MGCRTGFSVVFGRGVATETLVEFLHGCTVVGQLDRTTTNRPGTHSRTVPVGGAHPCHRPVPLTCTSGPTRGVISVAWVGPIGRASAERRDYWSASTEMRTLSSNSPVIGTYPMFSSIPCPSSEAAKSRKALTSSGF